MKWAYFHGDGRLAHVARGDTKAIVADPDTIAVKVADAIDPSAIYYDIAAGKVLYREAITLAADRTVLALDLAQAATVTGATPGSILEVDGVATPADGPIVVAAEQPGYIVVAPGLNRRGDLVSIRVALLAVLQEELRAERNRRLTDSDWTDTASAPQRLGPALHAAWLDYRQALRDVMNEQPEATIDTVAWPEQPGAGDA